MERSQARTAHFAVAPAADLAVSHRNTAPLVEDVGVSHCLVKRTRSNGAVLCIKTFLGKARNHDFKPGHIANDIGSEDSVANAVGPCPFTEQPTEAASETRPGTTSWYWCGVQGS